MNKPGVNVLTHRGKDDPKKPPIPTSGFGPQQIKVVLLAFDRTFGTGTSVTMGLEEVAIPGDKGVEPIVLFGIGVNDATIE